MSTPERMLPAEQPSALRRVVAFGVDGTIIGWPADALGALLFDPLSDLGEYGRLIGAAVIMLYFGCFDSRLGGGRSPGKRLLGLEVVSTTGGLISPARAAARALVAATPLLLNGIVVSNIVMSEIASLLLFGLGLSLFYLAIFNRPSRQCLHDLATASMVVRRGAQRPLALPLWRLHWVVVAAFAVVALVAEPVLYRVVDSYVDPDETDSITQRVEMLADVRSAHMSVSWSRKTSQADWAKKVKVVAALRRWPTDKTAAADAVAAAIYGGSEQLIADTPVTVVLVQGFTLGITGDKRKEVFPLDAKRWKAQRGV